MKTDLPVHIPYNPLEKKNIGSSIVQAMLGRPLEALPPTEPFIGAGVYAIYYKGTNTIYAQLARNEIPIYVGKAIPIGARKGNVGLNSTQGTALYNRLRQHADSIAAVEDFRSADFMCRYLAVDDIWIPLAETLLIERFRPVWNVAVDGFGNHDPGRGRYNQQRSAWDTLHSGRLWAKRLNKGLFTRSQLAEKVALFISSQS